MFTYDGKRYLVGLSNRYEWLVFDLMTRTSTARATPGLGGLLYGSATRDDQGDMYLGGTDWQPVFYRLRMPN
jgi:hypothetical protein